MSPNDNSQNSFLSFLIRKHNKIPIKEEKNDFFFKGQEQEGEKKKEKKY